MNLKQFARRRNRQDGRLEHGSKFGMQICGDFSSDRPYFRELFSEYTLRFGVLLIRMIPPCSEGHFIQAANSKGL